MEKISVVDVKKIIDGKEVIKYANVDISSSEICAFIGPNGAGKTTLLKCLLGLVHPDQGFIKIDNKVLSKSSRFELLRQIGTVLQLNSINPNMTIGELFEEHYHYLELEPSVPYKEVLLKLNLDIPVSTKVGKLSLGMKQRLQLALALSQDPNILILDEPFNGLDLDGVNLIKELLTDLKKQNVCIIITSHSLSDIEEFSSTVVFIFDGKTHEKKSVKSILDDYPGGLREYYKIIKEESTDEKKPWF